MTNVDNRALATTDSTTQWQERVDALLRAARDGNDLAFEELVRLLRTDVYRVALAILGKPEDAADAVQDTFLRMYKALSRLKSNLGIKAWLRRVTINRCYDMLRSRKREIDVDEHLLPGCMQISDVSGDPQIARLLQQCFEVLTPRERAALLLTCKLGYSSREAADAMGISDSTVRVLALKGRDKLRTLMMPKDNGWKP